MKKKFIGMVFILTSLVFMGCKKNPTESALKYGDLEETATPQVTVTQQPEEQVTVTPTPVEDMNWKSKQKEYILQQKPEYEEYTASDFKLGNSYVTVYEAPDADKDDWMNYSADIWAYGEDWVTPVEEGSWLLPDAFVVETIDGKECFRYERSYATDSVTVLLMLDEEEKLHILPLMGALFEIQGNNLTVNRSAYDLVYSKSDKLSTGHTWNPHYYYLEDYEIKEYQSNDISEEDFIKYKGARDILEQLKKEYQQSGKELNFGYQKRDNGIIHVNIMLESDEDITYYYETYKINEDHSLVSLSNGEGTYGRLPSDEEDSNEFEKEVITNHGEMDEIKEVSFVDYSEKNNSITVQNIEWLSPGSIEDKARIQELLEQGKISTEEDIWNMEFYIYSEPNDVEVYQLADDAKIVLLDEGITWKSFDASKLNEMDNIWLMKIYIKDDLVYLIYEIYTP